MVSLTCTVFQLKQNLLLVEINKFPNLCKELPSSNINSTPIALQISIPFEQASRARESHKIQIFLLWYWHHSGCWQLYQKKVSREFPIADNVHTLSKGDYFKRKIFKRRRWKILQSRNVCSLIGWISEEIFIAICADSKRGRERWKTKWILRGIT